MGSAVSLRMLWWLTDVARRAAAALIEGDCTGNLIIVEALRRWDETIPIVWEEAGLAADGPRPQPSRFWLVSAPEESDFIVSIALIDGDRPLAGVVFLPAADVVYFAGRNLGAWRQVGAQPAVRLRAAPPTPSEPVVVVEIESQRSSAVAAFLACLPLAERIVDYRLG